jgi:hypothetical protein
MTEPPERTRKRLLFILHRALVEARLLAMSKRHEQLVDLAEATHEIPAYMSRWEESHLERIRRDLQTYHDKHSGHRFDYVQFLEQWEIPPF